jgi:hypothetical protein
MEKSTNSLISSIPRTGKVNQLRDNGIKSMALRSILTSILFLLWDMEDTSTIFQEILSLRPKMVDQPRNGISISLQELLEVDQSTNLLISTTPEKETTCNTTPLHQDGGKCSSSTTDTSPMSKTVRYSLFQEEKMLKLNQFGFTKDIMEETLPKSGRLSTPMPWETKPMIRLEKLITNSV